MNTDCMNHAAGYFRMHLYDAHNHLQDDRFAGRVDELVREAGGVGVARMVVNGSCEEDWPLVETLAERFPMVLPSYGLHPWYFRERSLRWVEVLAQYLDRRPSAIGEFGLDRWREDLPYEGQEYVFLEQWHLARTLNRPASLHCLKAWGRLLDLLKAHPGPACGFLLHSYGGPVEMVPAFVKLGAYFSFPGYFAHERKERQRATFRAIPVERLLVETDAPDQGLPDEINAFPLAAPDGAPVNHPANLAAVYRALAAAREEEVETLAAHIAENFQRLFGDVASRV